MRRALLGVGLAAVGVIAVGVWLFVDVGRDADGSRDATSAGSAIVASPEARSGPGSTLQFAAPVAAAHPLLADAAAPTASVGSLGADSPFPPAPERFLRITVQSQDGSPLKHARIDSGSRDVDVQLGVTDAAGVAVIAHSRIPFMAWRPDVHALLVTAAQHAVRQVAVPRWNSEVTVTLRPSRKLTVVVVDPEDRAVPDADVVLDMVKGHHYHGMQWFTLQSERTDGNGRAVVELPEADGSRLSISRRGLALVREFHVLELPGDEIRMQLRPVRSLLVSCVDPDGRPIDGVTVKAEFGMHDRGQQTVSVGGLARFDPVPETAEEKAWVRGHSPDWEPGHVIAAWLPGQLESSVTLVLRPAARTTIEVHDEHGRPISGQLTAHFWREDSPGETRLSFPLVAGSTGLVGPLPPGRPIDFTVTEHGSDTVVLLGRSFEGGDDSIRLVVPPRYFVRVNVVGGDGALSCGTLRLDIDGSPADSTVARPGQAPRSRLVFTDSACPETTLLVPAGHYDVQFRGFVGERWDGRITVAGDMQLEIPLEAHRPATVRVVDERGWPLEGVALEIEGTSEVPEYVTDGNGLCRFPVAEPAQRTRIAARDAVGVLTLLGSRKIAPGEDLTLTWSRARVEGVVRAFSDGRPVTAGRVTLTPTFRPPSDIIRAPRSTPRHVFELSEHDGQFAAALTADCWKLDTAIPGYFGSELRLDLTPGGTHAITLWVHEPAAVTWLADEHEDLTVTATATGAGGEWTRTTQVGRNAGAVSLGDDLPAGPVTFTVLGEGGRVTQQVVTLLAGEEHALSRQLPGSETK